MKPRKCVKLGALKRNDMLSLSSCGWENGKFHCSIHNDAMMSRILATKVNLLTTAYKDDNDSNCD